MVMELVILERIVIHVHKTVQEHIHVIIAQQLNINVQRGWNVELHVEIWEHGLLNIIMYVVVRSKILQFPQHIILGCIQPIVHVIL